MISALVVLLLFLVDVSEPGAIFRRATNCESPLVYCKTSPRLPDFHPRNKSRATVGDGTPSPRTGLKIIESSLVFGGEGGRSKTGSRKTTDGITSTFSGLAVTPTVEAIVTGTASSDVIEKRTIEQVEVPTEEPAATEIAKSTPPTACNGTGRFAGPSCTEYYECIVVWWWFDLRLRFCADGFSFSVANGTCVPTSRSDCLN